MGANPKAIYWCVTSNGFRGEWRRGVSMQDVQQIALVRGKLKPHHVYQCILDGDTTEKEITTLLTCFGVNDWGCVTKCDGNSEEENALIDARVIGWIAHEHKGK